MGQYFLPVNLTKREFINPHALGSGLKLCEQLGSHVGSALIILCASMPERRGGGDLDLDQNWHGPERKFPEHNVNPGPMPDEYPAIARRTIGRWAGDSIAIVGDYAKDSDALPLVVDSDGFPIIPSRIYGLCSSMADITADPEWAAGLAERQGVSLDKLPAILFRDVTGDVCRVIEHELGGRFKGEGWRQFVENAS